MISLNSSQRVRLSLSLISGNSNDSVFSLPVTSFTLSGKSLKEIPDVSIIALPLVLGRVYNGRWYAPGTPGDGIRSHDVKKDWSEELKMAVGNEEWVTVAALLAMVMKVVDPLGTVLDIAITKAAPRISSKCSSVAG